LLVEPIISEPTRQVGAGAVIFSGGQRTGRPVQGVVVLVVEQHNAAIAAVGQQRPESQCLIRRLGSDRKSSTTFVAVGFGAIPLGSTPAAAEVSSMGAWIQAVVGGGGEAAWGGGCCGLVVARGGGQ